MPNILFIITDQQTAGAMSCAGADWVQTPNLDRLAARGVRFKNANCCNPLCVPSRAGMFTGQPSCLAQENALSFPNIGKWLGEQGFETAYFGKWHIGTTKPDQTPDWHGFETCEIGEIDSETAQATTEFLRKPHDRPFFVVSSFLNPHDCCEYSRQQAGLDHRIFMRNGQIEMDPPLLDCPPLPNNYGIPNGEPEAITVQRAGRENPWDWVHPTQDWDENQWRKYRWGYAQLVEKVDSEIGKVLNALEEEQHDRDTVIIFTSDHGDGASAHQWNQKLAFYEESVAVPLLLTQPIGDASADSASTDDRLVNVGIDLFPTLCDYAGCEPPAGLPGQSFRPGGSGEKHAAIFSEVDLPWKGYMVRTPQFKYIHYTKGEPAEMFFDLAKDPGEMENIITAASAREPLEQHRALLRNWMKRYIP